MKIAVRMQEGTMEKAVPQKKHGRHPHSVFFEMLKAKISRELVGIVEFAEIAGDKALCRQYADDIRDVETKSLYIKYFTNSQDDFNRVGKVLFLLPVTDQGYNFGQYSLVSHLVSLGMRRENISIFPLYVENSSYRYDKKALSKALREFKPEYICESAYIGWEDELFRINDEILGVHACTILMGGPLTSSHLPFCLQYMNAHIFFVGNGEYLLEEYFRCAMRQNTKHPRVNAAEICYPDRDTGRLAVPYVNMFMDEIAWDLPMLRRFCEITPVINLFTSNVCFGNCVFCYRTSDNRNCLLSADDVEARLRKIIRYSPLKQAEVEYIRFFDDDFLAAPSRDLDFLRRIANILNMRYKLYDLQLSIRSFARLDADRAVKLFHDLGLKRVVIGVDGYNNNDLLYLQKGYTIDDVFQAISSLSKGGIPSLLYAILTTFDTNYVMLNTTFMNMIRLVLFGNTYIGPTISPYILVHSDNKKLYPKFANDNIHYLYVLSVSDVLHGKNCVSDIVMHAALLPRNYLVRAFIQENKDISSMESAYVLPLVSKFYSMLAQEYNWLAKVMLNQSREQQLIQETYESIVNALREAEEHVVECKNKQDTIAYINRIHGYRRELDALQEKKLLAADIRQITLREREIRQIVEEYASFCIQFFDESNGDELGEGLHQCVRRLLPVPMLAFMHNLDNANDFQSIASPVMKMNFVMNEDEVELFSL